MSFFQTRDQVFSVVGALLIGLLLVALPPVRSSLEGMETGLYDMRMRLISGDRPADGRVRVLGIDGATRKETEGWGAASVGRLLANLHKAGAKGVFLMEAPWEGASSVAGELASFSGAVVTAAPDEPSGLRGGLLVAPKGWETDPDGVLRRPILARRGADGTMVPSPALYLMAAAEGVPASEIRYGEGGISVGAVEIPTDSEYRAWVQFRLPMHAGGGGAEFKEDPFQPASARKALEPDAPLLTGADGAVFLVGDRPEQAVNEVTTSADKMSFLEAEANVLDSLLDGAWFRRPSAGVTAAAVLALCLFMGVILPRVRVWLGLAIGLVFGVAYLFLNVTAFSRGLWLDLAAPMVAGGLVLALVLALQFARSSALLGRFLAPDMARGILKGQQSAGLGGQEKVCTILFFSLPGCLKTDGGMPIERRNAYTDRATEILVRHGGRVMDYQGDAQMVLFGAPKDIPNHAASAVAAALDLQEMNSGLMATWGVDEPARGTIHAGVCTGPLAVGFVGSEGHKEFAAIGDTTNVAARLYVAAMKMGIPVLVAGTTMEASQGAIEAEALPPVELKGKSQPVPVFRAVSVPVAVGGQA